MVTVSKLGKNDDVSAFFKFAWDVYKPYPMWVPPIIQQVKPFLEGKSLFFEHSDYTLLAAENDGKLSATAAVFYDENLNRHYSDQVGLIGFFEALPDQHEAVSLLLKAAEKNWVLKARGQYGLRSTAILCTGPVWQRMRTTVNLCL